MNIVLAISILLGYTIATCIKGGGVPNSLSASVFDLPKRKRWIWTVVLFSVCFLCVPTYVEVTSENTQFLAFIAIAALAFVGAAPLVADKADLAYKVHCVAAVVCAVCSQMVLVFNQPWLLLAWVPWILVFVWVTKDKQWRTLVFWAEMVCFYGTFAYCLIKKYLLCQ